MSMESSYPKCPNGCTLQTPVMVEVRGVYDGGLFYHCDVCKFSWHRWTLAEWPSLYGKAQEIIDRWNERHGFGT